jgi:hypothetical protein
MLTEINQSLFAVRVNGRTIATNLPSRQLAEATLLTLPQHERALAEIVSITSDGKTVLFG